MVFLQLMQCTSWSDVVKVIKVRQTQQCPRLTLPMTSASRWSLRNAMHAQESSGLTRYFYQLLMRLIEADKCPLQERANNVSGTSNHGPVRVLPWHRCSLALQLYCSTRELPS